MPTEIVLLNIGNFRTGGPEALFQLSHELNQIDGIEAKTFFITPKDEDILAEYRSHYDVRETTKIYEGAILVIPEGVDPRAYRHLKTRCWVWWLSATRIFPITAYEGCAHLFQSHYAQERIAAYGIKGLILSDYVRQNFLLPFQEPLPKENIIAFNGSKSALGALAVKMTRVPLELVPIANLSDSEVKLLLRKAKIYLDLGFHPGKDRMPREAALLDCLVVTSREGSAANDLDLPISPFFKREPQNAAEIADLLCDLLDEYDSHISQFEEYRAEIRAQKSLFEKEVQQFASMAEKPGDLVQPAISEAMQHLDAVLIQEQRSLGYWRYSANSLALSIHLQGAVSKNAKPLKPSLLGLLSWLFRKS